MGTSLSIGLGSLSVRRILCRLSLLLIASATLAACAGQVSGVRTLAVGPASFQTEIVSTPAMRQRGLMGRTDLSDEMAMLFVYPDEQYRAFWMKDTPTPLSIAYIDRRGVIKEILPMEPFSLEPVPSQYPVMYGLEVRRGAFERLGVEVGDRIDLERLQGITADH